MRHFLWFELADSNISMKRKSRAKAFRRDDCAKLVRAGIRRASLERMKAERLDVEIEAGRAL
jgi:hypothetical protein